MTRVLALFVLCLATSSAASEGVYFTEAVGGTSYKGDLDANGALRIRLSAGYRYKAWAVEGFVAAHISDGSFADSACDAQGCYAARTLTPPQPSNDPGADLLTYGIDVKRIARLTDHLELYVGAGLGRGVLAHGYAGNGLGLRAGAQVKGKVPVIGFLAWPLFFTNWGPKVTAALFLDNSIDVYRLRDRDGSRAVDAQLSSLTFGFAVGTDF